MKTATRSAEVWSTRPKPHLHQWLASVRRAGRKGERSKGAILDEALELLYEKRHSDRKRAS